MADLGFFRDHRVELIDGEIIEMPPQRDIHFAALSLTARALTKVFGNDYWVRIQGPLGLREGTEPEPDVAVVRGTERDFIGTGHPKGALLVVEVSDSTLAYDRQVKASLYAAHGIVDYWIVNLIDAVVEVHRSPVEDKAAKWGVRYESVVKFGRQESVSPLALAGSAVKVADLLP